MGNSEFQAMTRTPNPAQIILLIAGAAAIGLTWWNGPRGAETSDAVICDALDSFYQELQELRDQQASADEWDEFSDRVAMAISPYVSELKRTATSLRPVRQRLLFMTRDHLPDMLQTARKRASPSETAFDASLEEVRTMLAGELPETLQMTGENSFASP